MVISEHGQAVVGEKLGPAGDGSTVSTIVVRSEFEYADSMVGSNVFTVELGQAENRSIITSIVIAYEPGRDDSIVRSNTFGSQQGRAGDSSIDLDACLCRDCVLVGRAYSVLPDRLLFDHLLIDRLLVDHFLIDHLVIDSDTCLVESGEPVLVDLNECLIGSGVNRGKKKRINNQGRANMEKEIVVGIQRIARRKNDLRRHGIKTVGPVEVIQVKMEDQYNQAFGSRLGFPTTR